MIPTKLMINNNIITDTLNVNYYAGEIFVRVISYNGELLNNYYISNYGRLYSVKYNRLRTPQIDDDGYERILINLPNNKSIYTGIHKITLMSFYPILETNIFIPHHIDNNIRNNHISNLEWVTVSTNTQYAVNDGNIKTCQDTNRSLFSNEEVHHICKLIENNYSNTDILNELGLEYGKERNRIASIIRLIRRGQTYLNISSQYDIPGINGKRYYSTEMTKNICDALSDPNKVYRIDELCDYFNIDLNDRKMFANYVQDITRRMRDKHIVDNYPVLHSPLPLPKSHEYYKYYY